MTSTPLSLNTFQQDAIPGGAASAVKALPPQAVGESFASVSETTDKPDAAPVHPFRVRSLEWAMSH